MKSCWTIAITMLLTGCIGRGEMPPARVGTAQEISHDTVLMGTNRTIAEREEQDIEGWVTRNGLTMKRSGTGVRTLLLRDSIGPSARPGQVVAIDFRVSLLNGTHCYASEPGEPGEFTIDRDNVESGLHEAIQGLSVGDSAVIVIPSHRAHGLAGDLDKIPMRSTVVYHLRLVALN